MKRNTNISFIKRAALTFSRATSCSEEPMRASLFSRSLGALMLLTMMTATTAWALNPLTVGNYTFTVGTDDEGEYYAVDGTEALDALATYVNAGNSAFGTRFKQTADIAYTHTTEWNDDSSTESNFTAIGYYNNNEDRKFRGTFDGSGFTISGIRIYKDGTANTDSYQGLFGNVYRSTVKNVTLADTRITGYDVTGGIVGYNDNQGTVSNCRVESNVCIHSVQDRAENHGGVVGKNYGTVSDCFSAATVSTNCCNFGAIVGDNSGTLLRNTYVYTTCKGVGTGPNTSADVEGASVFRETVSITYIGADGTEQTTDAPKLIGGYDDNIAAGTYAVAGDIAFTNTFNITGDFHLILADGYTMTANAGISITDGTLNIYGQQGGSGTLRVYGTPGVAGKGGNYINPSGSPGGTGGNGINGSLTVNGGTINITGGKGGKGGDASTATGNGSDGGDGGNGINGSLTVNGGTINITSGEGGEGGKRGEFFTNDGSNGTAGLAVSGTVTFDTAKLFLQESDDESTWNNLTSGSTSTKRYIRTGGSFTMSGNEYTIWTAAGWDVFCDLLADNAKGIFDGKTVKLGADITVTRMAGGSHHDFTGTFDGDGHTLTLNYGTAESPIDAQFVAPFPNTEDNGDSHPTFRNLTIDGHIYEAYTGSEAHNVGGLIGHLYGTVTIEHCTSNVTITSTGGAGGFVGLCERAVTFTDCVSSAVVHSTGGNNSGFVGWSRSSNYAINFTGCLFNGKLLQVGGSGSYNGGFVGWKGDAKKVNITNCLVAPAALADGETMADEGSATFSREHANYAATITNSYYTAALGTAQGKQARSITAGENVTLALSGTATEYSVSGITAYSTGILYHHVCYAGNGDNVALTLGITGEAPADYEFSGYSASAGALTGNDTDGYTLTMPDENVTITSEWVSYLAGDVNGDGTISVADVALLVNYLLDKENDSFIIKNADVDGDGSITATDIHALVNMILEIDDK